MHRSVMRVFVAVGVFAAGGLAWTDLVSAAGHDINVTNDATKCDKTWGPPCFTPANGTVTPVALGEAVTWHVLDGTHTVTPVDPAAFTGSGDLTGPDGTFNVTFDKPGVFSFYCKHHGSVDKDGKTFHGMWGKIDVRADTTSSSAPAAGGPPPDGSPPPGKPDPGPPPPAGPPAPPPSSSSGSPPPPPPSNGSNGSNGQTAAGTGRPWVGPPPTAPPPEPPPPRTAAAAPAPSPPPPPSKGKEGGNQNTPSTPGATALPPDEAVLPPSPPFAPPTTRPAGAPTGAPQGDAVAVLKSERVNHHRKLILLGTVFGIGAFAAGVGGWKFTHRASKYWPA